MTGVTGFRRVDAVLAVLLVAAWFVVVGPLALDGISHGQVDNQVLVFPASGDDSHPEIRNWRTTEGWEPTPELGDEVLAIDGVDTAGCNIFDCHELLADATADGRTAQVTLERAGEVIQADVRQVATPGWWNLLPFSIALLGTAVALVFLAPEWHLARRWLLTCWMWSIIAMTIQQPPEWKYLAITFVLYPLALGFTIWNGQDLTLSARPVPSAHRAVAVVGGLVGLVVMSATTFLPLSRTAWYVLGFSGSLYLSVGALAGLMRCYRRADPVERRQIRWLILGFYFTLMALFPGVIISAVAVDDAGLRNLGFWLTAILSLGVPVGILISVLGYRWLDVDRVISSAATTTVLGTSAIVLVVGAVPPLAERIADGLGASAGVVQSVLILLIAALVFAGHRALTPTVDRRIFADRHLQTLGFEQLLDELARCTSATELTELTGRRLDELLAPSSIAIYARDDQAFTPVFVRGRGVPAGFDAESPLLMTLRRRQRPLSLDTDELDPFDRAALETLGGAVVVATRLNDEVIAFTCLGVKASGDIYTPEEHAYLTALASRASEVLSRIDGEAIVRDAQEMQQALRRYVPGAVADALADGRDLDAIERDVSVLFVDIRGYTTYAEDRQSAEVFTTINEYTERVSSIVTGRGGAVVEFHGDGMVAVFGAPLELDHKERAAVDAALDIVSSMPDELGVGIGIATGRVHVGNIRAADRMIWTVIGDTANLASRLQGLTRELDASIAVDDVTRQRAGDVAAGFEDHPAIQIRGRRGRCDVWTLPAPTATAVGPTPLQDSR